MLSLNKYLWLGCVIWAAQASAVGQMPVPVLNNARISADTTFNQSSQQYDYSYTVSNPASNTGKIWKIKIDVSANASTNGMANQVGGFTLPTGLTRETYAEVLLERVTTNNRLSEPWPLHPQTVIPFGLNAPKGWRGNLGIDSVASFSCSSNTPNIAPGINLGGFQLLSYGVPTIREVQLIPWWIHVVADHDAVPDSDRLAAGRIERDIIFRTVSLGPSGVYYGSFAHWDQLREDLTRARQLGWINEQTLADTLAAQLATARESLDAKDFYTAKKLLQPMLDTINQSTPTQRSSEGFALVYLNVQSLINNTPNNQIEPKLSLVPKSSLLSIGKSLSLTITVIDLANGNVPIADVPIHFAVDSGPNAGLILGDAFTDTRGIASVVYSSALTGADSITATAYYRGEVSYEDKSVAVWSGGPDLVVPFFTPPLLITKGGNKFYMSEETLNNGNVMAPPSVTRYYISATPILDTTTAIFLGERSIPALQPGKSNSINQRVFRMPNNLPVGTYYLAACADANSTVAELDETNNCSFSKIEGRQSFIVPMKNMNAANHDEDDSCDDGDDEKHRSGKANKKADHDDEHSHHECEKSHNKHPFEKREDSHKEKLPSKDSK